MWYDARFVIESRVQTPPVATVPTQRAIPTGSVNE